MQACACFGAGGGAFVFALGFIRELCRGGGGGFIEGEGGGHSAANLRNLAAAPW